MSAISHQTIQPFVHTSHAQRVVFGAGSLKEALIKYRASRFDQTVMIVRPAERGDTGWYQPFQPVERGRRLVKPLRGGSKRGDCGVANLGQCHSALTQNRVLHSPRCDPSRGPILDQCFLNRLSEEIDALGARRALVLSTAGQRRHAEQVAALLADRSVGVFDGAVMHVPIETARRARDVARSLGADCAIALGGGSTTGLGKAIALDSGLPIIAIPTTYSGSEMTAVYGLTENGVKKTGKDPRVLPRTVIYDPQLSVGLPVATSISSGFNAIAHAAEGLYARDANPIASLMAAEGIGAMARALPRICRNPADPVARTDALYGAWLCASVLSQVGMALHHKLCHTVGGSFNLPHADVHTVILPHALAFNAPAVPAAMDIIRKALASDGGDEGTPQAEDPLDASLALHRLANANGAPTSLRAIGMRAADLDRAADLAISNAYWNPRPIGRDQRQAIRDLLQRAYDGDPPA